MKIIKPLKSSTDEEHDDEWSIVDEWDDDKDEYRSCHGDDGIQVNEKADTGGDNLNRESCIYNDSENGSLVHKEVKEMEIKEEEIEKEEEIKEEEEMEEEGAIEDEEERKELEEIGEEEEIE